MEQFRKGNRLKLGDQTVTVERLLGVGGQGAVYQVATKGGPKALKWYSVEYLRMINQKAFYDNLARNVANKAPLDSEGRPSKNYLWPEAVSEFQEGNFGYLMDLRPSRFIDAGLYLNGQKNFKDTRTALRAMKTLCKEFQLLHRAGYSYQDINEGNFFIDVDTGDVLICDNDNVVPYGHQSAILGKDRYMAPEIVLGTSYPNEDTDLYSVSVVLFLLWFRAHPLEGKKVHDAPCLTPNVTRLHYAEDAVFVYDPDRTDNRPVEGMDKNILACWPHEADYLKEAFTRAFTEGLKNPTKRVRLQEWIDVFNRLENDYAYCPHCGNEFLNSKVVGSGDVLICRECRKEYRRPLCMSVRLKNSRVIRKIYLSPRIGKNPGSTLKVHDIEDAPNDDREIGEVLENRISGKWGLRNLSDGTWRVRTANGIENTIARGEILILWNDMDIDFGTAEAQIAM